MTPGIIAKIKADIATQEAYIAKVDGREDEYGKNQRYYSRNRIRTLNNELRTAITADIPLDRLEEICNAERDGRLVVLPCQLGQKVWYISDGKIDYGFAKWFESDEKDGWTVAVANPPRVQVYLKFECFGRIAFLSRDEAETALNKMKEDERNET